MTHDVIILSGADAWVQIVAFFSLVAGYFAKGLIAAFAGELIFKPLAHKLKDRFESWETTHPQLHTTISHYLENHPGRHGTCDKC